jgi:hypothetical protein
VTSLQIVGTLPPAGLPSTTLPGTTSVLNEGKTPMNDTVCDRDDLVSDQVLSLLNFYFRHGVAGTLRQGAEAEQIEAIITDSKCCTASRTDAPMRA